MSFLLWTNLHSALMALCVQSLLNLPPTLFHGKWYALANLRTVRGLIEAMSLTFRYVALSMSNCPASACSRWDRHTRNYKNWFSYLAATWTLLRGNMLLAIWQPDTDISGQNSNETRDGGPISSSSAPCLTSSSVRSLPNTRMPIMFFISNVIRHNLYMSNLIFHYQKLDSSSLRVQYFN